MSEPSKYFGLMMPYKTYELLKDMSLKHNCVMSAIVRRGVEMALAKYSHKEVNK